MLHSSEAGCEARGRELDLWQTAESLLVELQAENET